MSISKRMGDRSRKRRKHRMREVLSKATIYKAEPGKYSTIEEFMEAATAETVRTTIKIDDPIPEPRNYSLEVEENA